MLVYQRVEREMPLFSRAPPVIPSTVAASWTPQRQLREFFPKGATSYKWTDNPYKWPYKWITGVITPTTSVILGHERIYEIGFLSIRVVFHWTMIIGERVNIEICRSKRGLRWDSWRKNTCWNGGDWKQWKELLQYFPCWCLKNTLVTCWIWLIWCPIFGEVLFWSVGTSTTPFPLVHAAMFHKM